HVWLEFKEKAAKLLGVLRERFSDDEEVTAQLGFFERNPERYAAVLSDVLGERLEADPALRQSLQALVADLGPVTPRRQQGEDVYFMLGADVDQHAAGRVMVDQQGRRVTSMVGARIKHHG